jgi:hypothetical protein
MAAALGFLLILTCGPLPSTGSHPVRTAQSLGKQPGLMMMAVRHSLPRGFNGKLLLPLARRILLRGGMDDDSYDSEEGIGGDDDEEEEEDFEDIVEMKKPTRSFFI